MRYPVDTEDYLDIVRGLVGEVSPDMATRCRCYVVPLLNLAYDDGLHNLGAFPLDVKELVQFMEAEQEREFSVDELDYLVSVVQLLNEAAADGSADRAGML